MYELYVKVLRMRQNTVFEIILIVLLFSALFTNVLILMYILELGHRLLGSVRKLF